MPPSKESILRRLIEKMSPEEKVGQCLVVDFTGTHVTPHIINAVEKYNCAGLRVQTNIRYKNRYGFATSPEEKTLMEKRSYRHPEGPCKDLAYNRPAPRCSASEYASVLNRLKEIAMNRRVPVPLHVTIDQEGNSFEDFVCGDPRLFPVAMGLAATGDPSLVSSSARILAKQLKAAGVDWIHSPVLDVNTNPRNPEIGTRSFSDDPEVVARFGLAAAAGLKTGGIIATGKHFPGRGDSEIDSHIDIPVVSVNRKEMMRVHVAPYVEAIRHGLPAIMIAHSIYPALEKEDIPSTVSRSIITDLLKKELGFPGAITSDNMLMAGIIKRYDVLAAAIGALQAGTTLILLRDETPLVDYVYLGLVEAVKNRQLSQDLLDEAIYRNLSVKYDYGLFENGGIVEPSYADTVQQEAEAFQVEEEAARKSIVVLRNRAGILPLSRAQKVMLIDQTGGTQTNVNNFRCHPGIFWEYFLEQSDNVICVEIDGFSVPAEEETERVLRRMEECDVIIATDYEVHRGDKKASVFLRSLLDKGKPMIIVTNSPFQMPDEFDAVLVTFADNPRSLRAAAEIIYGKRKASGKLPTTTGGQGFSL